MGRLQISFFGEFALSSDERRLPVHVEQPGRKFPVPRSDRMPVLLDEQDPVVGVECQHGNGARMGDELASDLGIAVNETLATHVPHDSLESQFARQDRLRSFLVTKRVRHSRPPVRQISRYPPLQPRRDDWTAGVAAPPR